MNFVLIVEHEWTAKTMSDSQTVKTKYCDNCVNRNRCHTLCLLVNVALLELMCEKEIYNLCKKDSDIDDS